MRLLRSPLSATGSSFAQPAAAWLGLVPRQYSTGGKQTLLASASGNCYVRKLLVHGARSWFRHLDRTRDSFVSWLNGPLVSHASAQSSRRTCR
ncbi:MAG: IS110 family transposase, partial [Mesorhizobium sp.]